MVKCYDGYTQETADYRIAEAGNVNILRCAYSFFGELFYKGYSADIVDAENGSVV